MQSFPHVLSAAQQPFPAQPVSRLLQTPAAEQTKAALPKQTAELVLQLLALHRALSKAGHPKGITQHILGTLLVI